ncbi:hypothetical protein LT493_26515 [Streptomyces tricolor]|nr:hypothetical protein [Streptomyces tricolor]
MSRRARPPRRRPDVVQHHRRGRHAARRCLHRAAAVQAGAGRPCGAAGDALRVALGELVAALGDHRRALWHREDLVLNGAGAEVVEAARAASHATRSAVTAPLVAVSVLEPALAEPARRGRPGRVRPAGRRRPHRAGRPPGRPRSRRPMN